MYSFVHRIEIYLVDSVIRPSNNWVSSIPIPDDFTCLLLGWDDPPLSCDSCQHGEISIGPHVSQIKKESSGQ